MKVGSAMTKQFTKKEILKLIEKTFPDDVYDDFDTVCVVTETLLQYRARMY